MSKQAYAEAIGRPKMARGGKKTLRTIEHERSANGGHVFTHRFHNEGGAYVEPETHTFGADEGHKAMAHFAKHAGLEKAYSSSSDGDEDDKD